MLNFIFRFRGVFFSLLFIGYLTFLAPFVQARFSGAAHGPDWLFVGIILGVQVVELGGLLLKRPLTAYYATHVPVSETKLLLSYLFPAIFHLCFSFFLTLAAFGSLGGWNDRISVGLRCLSVGLFFLVLVKEAFFVAFMLPPVPSFGGPPRSRFDVETRRLLLPKVPGALTPAVIGRNLLGDLCMLIHSTLAYSVLWEVLAASSLGRDVGDYLGLSLFFWRKNYLGSRH